MPTRAEYLDIVDKFKNRGGIKKDEMMAMNRYHKAHFRKKGKKKTLVSAPKKTKKKSPTKKKSATQILLEQLSDDDISPSDKKRLAQINTKIPKKRKKKKKNLSDRIFDQLTDEDITSADEDSWGTEQSNTHYTNLLIKHYFATLLNIDTGGWDVAYIDPTEYGENMWKKYIKWVKSVRPDRYPIEMGFYSVAKKIQREFKELDAVNSQDWNEIAFWQRKSQNIWQQIDNYYTNAQYDWN